MRKSIPVSRRGLTILELVVVIAVLTLLTAILLPAVQNAREASRLIDCRNRLKQLGIANVQFHDSHGNFPVLKHHWNLLPFLDQQPLYDKLSSLPRFAHPDSIAPASRYDAADSKVKSITGSVSTFVCPSSDASMAALEASFFVNHGNIWTDTLFDGRVHQAVANGMASTHSLGYKGVRVAQVYDGTSNTAFYSETLPSIEGGDVHRQLPDSYSRRFFYKLTKTPTSTLDFGRISKTAKPSAPRNLYFENSFVGVVFDGRYKHIGPPNSAACQVPLRGQKRKSLPPSSRHTAGVNVLYVDGSTKFVSDDVDLQVWQNLGSRDSRIRDTTDF